MIRISALDAAESLSVLKLQLKTILDLFDRKSRIFYVDYPVHSNIGDLLINLGTERFFQDYEVPIYRRYSVMNMPNLSSLGVDENTTLLCHGGGNFGDLYPKHQEAREALVDAFPRARIIFLPQSLYYTSQEAQARSLKRIARHSNCHILARDQQSLDALRSGGITRSSMMPDMSHQLWGTIETSHAAVPLGHLRDIYFLRRDQEATGIPVELAGAISNGSADWSDIVSTPHRALAGAIYYLAKAVGRAIPCGLATSTWYYTRDLMVRDAVAYFSQCDCVYTNRLHAMILALLLGRDVTAFDNSYGKLSRYAGAWLTAIPRSTTA
jgi:exopolysaccharide biosynthesis predicted pyruvyltransferase EpsI